MMWCYYEVLIVYVYKRLEHDLKFLKMHNRKENYLGKKKQKTINIMYET